MHKQKKKNCVTLKQIHQTVEQIQYYSSFVVLKTKEVVITFHYKGLNIITPDLQYITKYK